MYVTNEKRIYFEKIMPQRQVFPLKIVYLLKSESITVWILETVF